MVDTSLSLLKAAKSEVLLKPLDAGIWLAPHYTPHPTAFTSSNSALQTLPAAYVPVGHFAKADGIAFARSTETSNLESYGEMQPTRMDITADSTTFAFTPQETNKLVLELTTAADLDAVKGDAESGEVFFAQPTAPSIRYYSAIVIGQDGSDEEPIYVFKVLPKVAVSNFDGENWTPSTSLGQKLTLTAFKDDTAGFAVGHGFGGLGWKNKIEKFGFELATP
ncbi:phage tail tube protein [Rhodococcoides fascians]|uniref:phage tail tube protein n=1 Tax=Rhodococcoides fascians TaxID=1828 RepID=UPI0006919E2C|nr:hypothetical protein [Rhodococcus fascians]